MLQYVNWKTLEVETLNPLFDRQLVVGEQVMVARIIMKKGAHVPLHSHMNEQITQGIKGALKFWWESEMRIVRPGDTIMLPAGTLHQSEALEGGAIYAIATRPPTAAGN